MAFYQFICTQSIPASIDEVWDFMSRPSNLKEITPNYMNFSVTSKSFLEKIYPGMILSYKVSPMLNIPITWVTEITQVQDKQYFVDEQRVGPYKIWHHEHHLRSIEGGVLMTDIVSYQPPMGIIGKIANTLFIQKQLNAIFDYRTKAIQKRFGRF